MFRNITINSPVNSSSQNLETAVRQPDYIAFLSMAGSALAATTEVLQNVLPQAFLDECAQLCVPSLADCCIIEINKNETWPSSFFSVAKTDPNYQTSENDDWIEQPLTQSNKQLGVIRFARLKQNARFTEANKEAVKVYAVIVAQALKLLIVQEQALKSIRLREELLAVVSHDLKNPLSAILMNITLFLKLLPTQAGSPQMMLSDGIAPLLRKQAESIRLSANRMRTLIQDLLHVSKNESGHLRLELATFSVKELLNEVIEEHRSIALLKSQSLITDFDELPHEPQTLVLHCDKTRVIQVLSNLIGNALKFGKDRGRVQLRVKLSDKSMACFQVQDDGHGISAEELAQVFDRYWQAQGSVREGTGSGLGLYIAKGIVEAHGGKIWAESIPGSGSSFYFTLPLASSPT
jgi:signal transduction histidine kinase